MTNNAHLLGMLNVTPTGGRFISGLGEASGGALGDDSAVMMLSGVGSTGSSVQPSAQPTTTELLQTPVTLFNITLPLWGWLLAAAVLGGAGGWFANDKLKEK